MPTPINTAMRRLVMAVMILGAAGFGTGAAGASSSATRQPKKTDSPSPGASQLAMVHIRASSPGALRQLRAMPVDIVRVRPDPQRPADVNALAGGIIIEAVVPRNLLPKLNAAGFDVVEVPPGNW